MSDVLSVEKITQMPPLLLSGRYTITIFFLPCELVPLVIGASGLKLVRKKLSIRQIMHILNSISIVVRYPAGGTQVVRVSVISKIDNFLVAKLNTP